jgi:RNA polymerase sigma-70 factor (ECF subfamily)
VLIDAEQRFVKEQEANFDLQLIEKVNMGDRQAFHDLYNRHYKRIFALTLRLTANESLAEEALQEVFVQLWQKLSSFDGKAKFTTWLHSVAANITISYLRKQTNWLQKVVSFEQAGMPEQEVEMCNDLNGLDKYIVRLPEKARLVFVLFAVEGYRHEEIAEQLNMAVGSSKAQYHRARSLLKEWMSNETD